MGLGLKAQGPGLRVQASRFMHERAREASDMKPDVNPENEECETCISTFSNYPRERYDN